MRTRKRRIGSIASSFHSSAWCSHSHSESSSLLLLLLLLLLLPVLRFGKQSESAPD
jgi:MYXO-CTERM domain-containing protein